MKKLLLTLALIAAAITLVGCTGPYEAYPVVSGGSDIHQSHHRRRHHRNKPYRHYASPGPVIHSSGRSGISQSHY